MTTTPMTNDELAKLAATLSEALERQTDNMAFALNHFSIPHRWHAKFSAELEADRLALRNHLTKETPRAE